MDRTRKRGGNSLFRRPLLDEVVSVESERAVFDHFRLGDVLAHHHLDRVGCFEADLESAASCGIPRTGTPIRDGFLVFPGPPRPQVLRNSCLVCVPRPIFRRALEDRVFQVQARASLDEQTHGFFMAR
jgi:hypothetical protein